MAKRKVKLHWLTGEVEELEGIGNTEREIAANAMNYAGYGHGALQALDYWEVIDVEQEGEEQGS